MHKFMRYHFFQVYRSVCSKCGITFLKKTSLFALIFLYFRDALNVDGKAIKGVRKASNREALKGDGEAVES